MADTFRKKSYGRWSSNFKRAKEAHAGHVKKGILFLKRLKIKVTTPTQISYSQAHTLTFKALALELLRLKLSLRAYRLL